ncbi:dNA repair photolyase [Roseburia sp. CAG:100]|jgi:DNA repair photolyase|nr:dNA repair photolyase [Roseburia sp. CAG:100]
MHFVEAKGILSSNNGMNIYRGCTHGCIYCDSRSKCYGFTHEFEDIEVKINAPQLLEKALKSKRKKCMIGTGAMCDPYLHIEENLKLTRKCLELIDQYEYGVAVQTKSTRVLRDMDLLKSINDKTKAVVQMTMTTYDETLCKILEPNVSTTKERFETLLQFKEAGIPTVVWLTPILPLINDTEENIRGILEYCVEAGVKGIICFGMGVTLRDGNREYFYKALDKHFPGIKNKYIRTYGNAYDIPSPNNENLLEIFKEVCVKNGMIYQIKECFQYLHEFPQKYEQMSLLDI